MTLPEHDRRLLREAADLTEFFGHSLSKVHKLLMLIARQRASSPPEWLRGARHLSHLPRYRMISSGVSLSMAGYSPVRIAEQIAWIVEHQHGEWCMVGTTIRFALERDAVHFRLRWSHD